MAERRKEPTPIQIREYQPNDYSQVRSILEETKLFSETWDNEQNLRAKIETEPESILVAIRDDKVVGSVYVVHDGWGSWIFHLAVRENMQQHGIGAQLLQVAEAKLKAKGAKEVNLFADGNNFELQKFYAKRGYKPSGRYLSMRKRI